MSPGLLGLLAALAFVGLVPRTSVRTRSPRAPRRGTAGRRRGLRAAVPLLAGVATAVLVGGPVGVALGLGAGIGVVVVLARLEPGARRRHRESLERQAPLVVDLVAACLASGAPLERSLEVAAAAVGAPAADLLARATASLRLGADPGAVWAEVATEAPLAGLARAVARSQQTGAPLAALLPRVAEQARAAHRVRAESRIRTAAVRLTAPLGLAFLPAFVLLGVVPVVASWVGTLV